MPQSASGNNPEASMHKEVRAARAQATGESDELPRGTQAEEEVEEIQASAEDSSAQEAAAEEAQGEAEGSTEASVAEEDGEPIRIHGREFKSAKEAFEYAEQIAREKELTDAHAQGIREALEAQKLTQAPAPELEEDFDTKFYSDPKGTLKEIQARARDEAIAAMKAENDREKKWNEFLSENPDIRRKDAERVLSENWETIGKMTDLHAGKKLLAQKVRAEYAEILEHAKPRTELSGKKPTQVPSGGAKSGVTPPPKQEKILSFIDQMRKLRQ